MGMPGGRIAKAVRGGCRSRPGGAKLQETVFFFFFFGSDDAASSELSTGRATLKLTQNRSEEHTSELQSLMRISYAVFCLKKNSIIPMQSCRTLTRKKMVKKIRQS